MQATIEVEIAWPQSLESRWPDIEEMIGRVIESNFGVTSQEMKDIIEAEVAKRIETWNENE